MGYKQVVRCTLRVLGSNKIFGLLSSSSFVPPVALSVVSPRTAGSSLSAAAHFSSSSTVGYEWRQRQLRKLEEKFQQEPSVVMIESEDELQPTWKEMESRVTRRRPRTVEEMGGRTGRRNIKSTEEEYWMQEGLYQDDDEDKHDEKTYAEENKK